MAVSSIAKFPPLPAILLGNRESSDCLSRRPTVDDQLYDIYGDEDDFAEEASALIDIPTTLIFYEASDGVTFQARLPLANRTLKLLTYSVYPSTAIFKVNLAIGLLKAKEAIFLTCATGRDCHDASLTHFKEGHFCVQVMEYSPAGSTMISALRNHWSKTLGKASIECHYVKNLTFLKCPRGFSAVSEAWAAFEPQASVGDCPEENEVDDPTWFDLEENWKYLGYVLRPATAAMRQSLIKVAQHRNAQPPPLPATTYIYDIPSHFFFTIATGLALAVCCAAAFSIKMLL